MWSVIKNPSERSQLGDYNAQWRWIHDNLIKYPMESQKGFQHISSKCKFSRLIIVACGTEEEEERTVAEEDGLQILLS